MRRGLVSALLFVAALAVLATGRAAADPPTHPPVVVPGHPVPLPGHPVPVPGHVVPAPGYPVPVSPPAVVVPVVPTIIPIYPVRSASPYNPLMGPPYLISIPPEVTTPRVITIKGRRYEIVPTGDRGDYPEDEQERVTEPEEVLRKANIPVQDRYSGSSRRIAKTTIFDGPAQEFNTLGDLLNSLPSNSAMASKNISNSPTTNRVAEEKKNVRVKAFIYAFKKEPDKDFHVILGDAPGIADQRYMNVEVSGIPIAGTTENRNRLWAVRRTFRNEFQLGMDGPRSYVRITPPVPVRISGSLFWDTDHERPPFVGPQSHKPKTAWEIHPVSEIEFVDP